MATIAIQWATDPATGWQYVDHTDWGSLPFAGPPPADRQPVFDGEAVIGFTGTAVSHAPPFGSGYISRVCYRGVTFQSDRFGWRKKAGAQGYVEVASITDPAPAIGPFPAQTGRVVVYRIYAQPTNGPHLVPYQLWVDSSLLGIETDPRFEVANIANWTDPGYEYAYGIWLTDTQHAALRAIAPPPQVQDWDGDAL